tara:strand:- start:55 stop:885 length:831 start_codon:yes stop_codon:yes gene_type:complete
MTNGLKNAPLGKHSQYIDTYSPNLLFPLLRSEKRLELGIETDQLPFTGQDYWTGYEISWLNLKGKPEITLAEFIFPCQSSHLVESKSFKLYLNSFNQSVFSSSEDVLERMQIDLSAACRATVNVQFITEEEICQHGIQSLPGICLDTLDIECNQYQINPNFIKTKQNMVVNEVLFSNLLKSNCLVTGQPDWGSVWIEYSGYQLDKEALLKYIISFRNHNEFHEQCVERIFNDLMTQAKCENLSVYARYTRRGGLDINPFRSTHLIEPKNKHRLFRQ